MLKILLADDMRNFLDLEISFLRRTDSKILLARDGAEALRLVKSERPDIALLDLEMPKMTGIECCRILKSDERLRKIPIIIVTSYPKKDECMKAGADDFIQKPITEKQLLEGIKKYVPIKEREDTRLPISVLSIYRYKNKTYAAYTRDLSPSGAFIVTRDVLPIGSNIKLELELVHPKVDNGQKIKVDTEVVRIEKGEEAGYIVGGMGLRFLNIEEKERKKLKGFIDTVSSK